jgi:hypothetical protein
MPHDTCRYSTFKYNSLLPFSCIIEFLSKDDEIFHVGQLLAALHCTAERLHIARMLRRGLVDADRARVVMPRYLRNELSADVLEILAILEA